MRNAFSDELTRLAATDERIVLLSGDIGNRLFDRFKAQCPTRFYNCGVAEANMTSLAAGLALSGLKPITYTITPFNTTRCLEQIRLDVCYHNLPVILVGVGAGVSYSELGSTHHALEDISFLRSLPNMTVVCPGDAVEVRAALRAALEHGGPVYLRLGKKNEPVLHRTEPDFKIGRGLVLRPGRDVCLLSTGNILPEAAAAADRLEERGLSAQLVSFHTVKPLDEELLKEAFDRFQLVATIEEHSLVGGLGGAVAEWRADNPAGRARLLRIGAPDRFAHRLGKQAHARQALGLTAGDIAARIMAEAEIISAGIKGTGEGRV
ncbi:MAG: transketolase C-terminal domain-containing protein [Thermodesulfobacteriota bacterium]